MSKNYNKKSYKSERYTPKSGATLHSSYGSEKGLFITVWKVEDGVLWKGKIFRSEKQSEIAPTQSGTGKKWASCTVVLDAPFKTTIVLNALVNVENHKVYIKEWNYMANPKAANGGYFGKHISKN
ncbi:hypothetical protein [Tenacibaculum soleae]|uniref:hypothetical protein n=1 Tax=Tenacibaculum soleae TaxID=447689 RepID=UPI002300379C|nr:hypothetical protein [Tenacibaculum soleae]